jgi:hypothetical protein
VDRNTFEGRLKEAAGRAVVLAREFVQQVLPDRVVFRIYPNQSYDGNPRIDDEEVFPDETLPEGGRLGPWSAEEVVGFLWRKGKIPEWIDTAVQAEDGTRSFVGLRCCGRFGALEHLLYHRHPDGVPPFSIMSPALPPGWVSVEASGRFDLYWAEHRRLNPEQKRACLVGPCVVLRFLVRPECRTAPRQQMEGISDSGIFHRWMDLLWTFREPEVVALLTDGEKICLKEFNAIFDCLPWQPIRIYPHISEVPGDDLSKLFPSATELLFSLEKRTRPPFLSRCWRMTSSFFRLR